MKPIKIIKIFAAISFAIIYIFFASALKTTPYAWIFTRIFGLISILLLFTVVLLGELRLIGYHRFFKFHHFLGISTFYIILLHFISAIFEKFKWGKNLSIIDYLGTNFSDIWMIALSIGAIAFYLIILIGITSTYSVMRKIGYRKWKLTHFVSYIILLFAFFHSIILGTDFKHSGYSIIVFPVSTFIFTLLLSLLALRIGKIKFDTRKKTAGLLLIILPWSASLAYFSTRLNIYAEELDILNKQNFEIIYQIEDLTNANANIEKINSQIRAEIDNFKKMSATLSQKIKNYKSVVTETPIILPIPEPEPIIEPEIQTQPPEPYNNIENDDRYEQEYEYEDD
jgi:DMSO/TMAO reductase YedYZ heme-binding membrane subunit